MQKQDDCRKHRLNAYVVLVAILCLFGVIACAMVVVDGSIKVTGRSLERAEKAIVVLRDKNTQLVQKIEQLKARSEAHVFKSKTVKLKATQEVNYKSLYEALQEKVDDLKLQVELEQSRIERLTAINKGLQLKEKHLRSRLADAENAGEKNRKKMAQVTREKKNYQRKFADLHVQLQKVKAVYTSALRARLAEIAFLKKQMKKYKDHYNRPEREGAQIAWVRRSTSSVEKQIGKLQEALKKIENGSELTSHYKVLLQLISESNKLRKELANTMKVVVGARDRRLVYLIGVLKKTEDKATAEINRRFTPEKKK